MVSEWSFIFEVTAALLFGAVNKNTDCRLNGRNCQYTLGVKVHFTIVIANKIMFLCFIYGRLYLVSLAYKIFSNDSQNDAKK